MNCVVREDFPKISNLDHHHYARALALMFPGVLVATAKTEAIGASEIPQLALATILIASLSRWNGPPSRKWCGQSC